MSDDIFRDREILADAQERGGIAPLGAYLRLSGPGWLQSAITLGGGSLAGALYLGMLGGTSMLWLQLVAIVIGVIMLSAISYVTLSTGKRPFEAINEYVNPVLGVGWITATILANMIFILPQFSLCYDALDTNLLASGTLTEDLKLPVSCGIGVLALIIVLMSFRPGLMSRIFDLVLKLIVGTVVVCFVAVVYLMATKGELDWAAIGMGFIPNLFHWQTPSPDVQALLTSLPGEVSSYWEPQIIARQQSAMIGVTATAVGLNMTFLLPYSMIARGWDKTFRGLARWDLITGMAIPYIVVTTCIVIASASAFHATADAKFLSDDPTEIQQSPLFSKVSSVIQDRYLDDEKEFGQRELDLINEIEDPAEQVVQRNELVADYVATMVPAERKVALTLVKPTAGQLAISLEPLLGEQNAKLVFGIGALAMGFSTIVILMLINGYAFAELYGYYHSIGARSLGAVAAMLTGISWVWIWGTGSRTWLLVVASTFAAILLPIAYVSFFALMNNSRLLGHQKPTGLSMVIWNVLMLIGIAGSIIMAWGGFMASAAGHPEMRPYLIGGLVAFGVLAVLGFGARFQRETDDETSY